MTTKHSRDSEEESQSKFGRRDAVRVGALGEKVGGEIQSESDGGVGRMKRKEGFAAWEGSRASC